ncbi:MAG: enoyl-CoA hydratase/isomerase family protein [Salinarimonas sp.]|nr:enoyl-CoA hydratase/isomerase family protein [Salinarimonas sp.]
MTTPAERTADSEMLYTVEDGIARVVFNRPQAMNAFTYAMYDRLVEICTTVNADPAVRVMLLSGAGGKAFAAGTDIGQFRTLSGAEDALAYEDHVDRVFTTLETCRVPTIAAITGAVTGGGAGIASCCDIRIASADMRFGFPIARTLGNCLSVRTIERVVALIGEARTKQILYSAELMDAGQALAAGFVTEILPDQATLDARADMLATRIAQNAPLTLSATKEGLARLRKGPAVPGADDDLILRCYLSEDFREGMEAFLAKRKPRWQGK